MAIAYSILAHKNAPQLERLFRAIHHAEDCFVLHVDSRADVSLKMLCRRLASEHSNVVLLRSRAVVWGGFRMVDVQLNAAEVALERWGHWSHFVNLTGQDFPLKNRSEILRYFDCHKSVSFVSWFDPLLTPIWPNAAERISSYYIESSLLQRLLSIPGFGRRFRRLAGWHNTLPHVPFVRRGAPPFPYYGGANHVVLSRNACEYLTTNAEAHRIRNWLKWSAHPDESVFQSVLLNSVLSDSVVNADLREIDFPKGAPSPNVWTAKAAERLLGSSNFWARKFDLSIDTEIIEILERAIGSGS